MRVPEGAERRVALTNERGDPAEEEDPDGEAHHRHQGDLVGVQRRVTAEIERLVRASRRFGSRGGSEEHEEARGGGYLI